MATEALVTGIPRRKLSERERFYMASQWQLMWRKFRRHRLAILGGTLLLLLYLAALFCGFVAPYEVGRRDSDYLFAPPQRIHFIDEKGQFSFQPAVYGYTRERNKETLELEFTIDPGQHFPLRFLHHGDPYKFWGLLRCHNPSDPRG